MQWCGGGEVWLHVGHIARVMDVLCYLLGHLTEKPLLADVVNTCNLDHKLFFPLMGNKMFSDTFFL